MKDEEGLADLIRRAAVAENHAEAAVYLTFDDEDLEVLLLMARNAARN